jgi:hypothetical protein
MIKNILPVALTFFYFFGNAQFIATYGFAAVTASSGPTDPSVLPVVNGINFKPFTAYGVANNPSAAGRFSFNGWPLGATDGVDDCTLYTGALSGLSYYEVSLTVDPGYTLYLNEVSFGMRRSTTGVRNFSIRSHKDNFSSELAAGSGTNTKVSVIPTNVFFWKYDSVSTSSDQRSLTVNPGPTPITDSIVLRFYAWNAEASGGSFSIDNVSFKGNVLDTLTKNPVGITAHEEETAGLSVHYDSESLQIQSHTGIRKVELFDVFGNLLLWTTSENEKKQIINAAALREGVYLLRAFGDAKPAVRRFVIARP